MKLSKLINEQGYKDGWVISYTGIQDPVHNKYELQRLDDMGKFECDDDAIRFVVNKAIEDPKSAHAKAILFLAKESPNELDGIVRSCVKVYQFNELLKTLKISL